MVEGGGAGARQCYVIIRVYEHRHQPGRQPTSRVQMTKRAIGRPWTAYEDELLASAVAVHGQVDNWKAVALSVPGRTNKACRKASRPTHLARSLPISHTAVASFTIAEREEDRLDKGRR